MRRPLPYLLALAVLVLACAEQGRPPAPSAARPAPSPPPSPYAEPATPLSPRECGRCHLQIYELIRNAGGKHRLPCTRCHRQYHRYNPLKRNWAQIMPKCQACHQLPHGEAFARCQACHQEPHSPLRIPLKALEPACSRCHPGVAKEVATHPSRHQQVGCAGCHREKHGHVPSCMECHRPHLPQQKVADCLRCHPVHAPLVISYPEDTPSAVCASCHTKVGQRLQATASKHGQLTCARCHPAHGKVPRCQDCHGTPHSRQMLARFPQCLQCHGDPHDLR